MKRFIWSVVLGATWGIFGLPPAEAQLLRTSNGYYTLEVLVNGMPSEVLWHAGQNYVLAQKGHRYTLRIHNHSPQRIEAVATVDGLDVLDGKRGSYAKHGYLIEAYSFVDIDGWRLSDHDVAAFRFSSVAASYAGRTGRARNVGVIGVAIFPEREVVTRIAPPQPPPMHHMELPARSQEDHVSQESAGAAAPSMKGSTQNRALRSEQRARSPQSRPGLATAFGERLGSPVQSVSFQRRNPSHPSCILGLRYNDHQGLLAMGVPLPSRHEATVRHSATPFVPVYAAPPPGWR
jgi:hypothetical protein